MPGIIGYERVSTRFQENSGLGLDSQRAAIEAYAKRIDAPIIKIYREIESGKSDDNRPELHKALAHAKRAKATLTVSKLDRLSRNVRFLATVFESGVDFAALDLPGANRLTLNVMAAIAAHEREIISERTKSALAALRARGVKLGSARPDHWKGREHVRLEALARGRAVASANAKASAQEAYADVLPLIKQLRDGGATFEAIAKRLNDDGQTTRNGKRWYPSTVWQILVKPQRQPATSFEEEPS